MKRFHSIKKNSDFQTVYSEGKSYANKLLVMYVKRKETDDVRIGIAASKKVGNSIVRHHLVRLIRECFRLHESDIKTGTDIVVVVRTTAQKADYKSIESAYMHLCGLHHIIRKEESK